MTSNRLTMIPVLTTPAGTCMTGENWQAAGVKMASFYLSALLMKPGFDALKNLPNLATYVGWEDGLVLNAALSNQMKDGRYALRSEYDGRRFQFTMEDIFELISRLQPDKVLLPEGVTQQKSPNWQSLPDGIIPFLSATDILRVGETTRPYGVYFHHDKVTGSLTTLLDQLSLYQGLPCYVKGDIDRPLMQALVHHGVDFIESDIPASDACRGYVYSHEGDFLLEDRTYAMQFEVIDADCQCPVCRQQLTRAYLHHLLEHTPLLCQRYLVQHNMYYCQAAFVRESD